MKVHFSEEPAVVGIYLGRSNLEIQKLDLREENVENEADIAKKADFEDEEENVRIWP